MALQKRNESSNGVIVEQNDEHLLTKVHGVMYKWTNFVYGWQKRYFELENGVLVYYRSEAEKQYGSRGSVALHVAQLVENDIDCYRFNILTSSTCWHLKAESLKSRNLWLRALKYQMNNNRSSLVSQNSDFLGGSVADTERQNGSLKKRKNHFSADDLEKSSEQSAVSLELLNKMEELQRYSRMIGRQTARLEKLTQSAKDNAKDHQKYMSNGGNATNVSSSVTQNENFAIALLDESLALNAVTVAVLQNINICVNLLVKQTTLDSHNQLDANIHQNEEEKLVDNNSQLSIAAQQISIVGSIMSDDEQDWHDAHESTPEKSSEEEKRSPEKLSQNPSSQESNTCHHDDYSIKESPPKKVTLPTSHRIAEEINRIAMEQLKYAQAGVQDKVWQLFMEEGEMKMYKRELEINGIVYDPLKAVHLVEGVSAREYIHYFFEPRYKHEWDETLIKTRVVERISVDTVIVHQLHKRVWPSAQRESLFWSNVRYLPKRKSADALDLYMVCNHDCDLPEVKLQHSSNIRVGITVAMLCETLIKEGHEKPIAELKRDDIRCRICYCAQVDPGGWVPVSALRVIYKREYPKFLRGFTQYVLSNVKSQTLVI